MSRREWTPSDVIDVDGPTALLRTYLEQRTVRDILARVAGRGPVRAAADVGCGFGRLTPVLGEFAPRVVGFEREAALARTARRLQPGVDVIQVGSLAFLPAATGAFDVVLVFTVLQHLADEAAHAAAGEIVRVASAVARVLLVEETDPALEAGAAERPDLGYTRGRSVETYATWLRPLELLDTRPRRIEPSYPRPDVGTCMLFACGR